MTTPRVYTAINLMHSYMGGELEINTEYILLSDHKEVVKGLEAEIEKVDELYEHKGWAVYNFKVEKVADVVKFLRQDLAASEAIVKRQALAIEKLKEFWLDELEDNCWGEVGDKEERNFERVKAEYWAEITAILQEAK